MCRPLQHRRHQLSEAYYLYQNAPKPFCGLALRSLLPRSMLACRQFYSHCQHGQDKRILFCPCRGVNWLFRVAENEPPTTLYVAFCIPCKKVRSVNGIIAQLMQNQKNCCIRSEGINISSISLGISDSTQSLWSAICCRAKLTKCEADCHNAPCLNKNLPLYFLL